MRTALTRSSAQAAVVATLAVRYILETTGILRVPGPGVRVRVVGHGLRRARGGGGGLRLKRGGGSTARRRRLGGVVRRRGRAALGYAAFLTRVPRPSLLLSARASAYALNFSGGPANRLGVRTISGLSLAVYG